MTARVRLATPEDAPRLAELRWEFRAGRSSPVEDRDVFIERCAAWMHAQLTTSNSWRAWVAESAGGVVGQVWVQEVTKLPNPVGERERHAYLSNLYVSPDARGGTGTQLLVAAIEWCETMLVDRVLLQPTPRSRPLYMRHGFSDRVGFLELKLPRGDD